MPRRGGFKLKIEGIDTAIAKMRRLGDTVLEQSKVALADEVGAILADAKAAAPVVSGRLRESGRIEKASSGPASVRFDIVFGGNVIRGRKVDYAAEVNAKTGFASNAWSMRIGSFMQRLQRRIREKMRR